jgi:phage-related protein
MFGILPQRYVCENCGYEGALVLEKDDESTQPPESDEKSP